MAGEGDHTEVGQYFSGTNIFAAACGDKYNTEQCKHRNATKKWAWTVGRERKIDQLTPG